MVFAATPLKKGVVARFLAEKRRKENHTGE